MTYLPDESVIEPFVVPFTRIVTPGIGLPFSSVTVPAILFCWIVDAASVALSEFDFELKVLLPETFKTVTIKRRKATFMILNEFSGQTFIRFVQCKPLSFFKNLNVYWLS